MGESLDTNLYDLAMHRADIEIRDHFRRCTQAYLVATEDVYETMMGDGKFFHYFVTAIEVEDAQELWLTKACEEDRRFYRHIFPITLDFGAKRVKGLPWCVGWDGTLCWPKVLSDYESSIMRSQWAAKKRANARCRYVSNELFQVLWAPSGLLGRQLLASRADGLYWNEEKTAVAKENGVTSSVEKSGDAVESEKDENLEVGRPTEPPRPPSALSLELMRHTVQRTKMR
jgi:hypothetical protein